MRKGRVLTLVSSLVLVLGLALLANPFASVSNAQTQGKVDYSHLGGREAGWEDQQLPSISMNPKSKAQQDFP